MLEASVRQHLHEVGDFAAGAEAQRADNEADGGFGELGAQALDLGNGGVVKRLHAEEEFEFRSVHLAAVAGEPGVHARVDTFERLEDCDGRREGRGLADAFHGADEIARTPQRKQHVRHTGDREERRERLKCHGHGVSLTRGFTGWRRSGSSACGEG